MLKKHHFKKTAALKILFSLKSNWLLNQVLNLNVNTEQGFWQPIKKVENLDLVKSVFLI